MVSFVMMTPPEIEEHIAKQARLKRLSLNLSQQSLSERSGVSFGVLKKFERTGKISLESLLKIAFALDALSDFKSLFELSDQGKKTSLDEIMQDKSRKRGRK